MLRKGIKRHKKVPARPRYKNSMTSGLTATDATIPTGVSFLNIDQVTGLVISWAPALSLRALLSFGIKRRLKSNLNREPKVIMPVRAP